MAGPNGASYNEIEPICVSFREFSVLNAIIKQKNVNSLPNFSYFFPKNLH